MSIQKVAIAGASMLGIMAGPSFAKFPRDVIGTWTIINGQAQDTLVISSQVDVGAKCGSLSGNLVNDAGSNSVTGFYCGSTGRIIFVRFEDDRSRISGLQWEPCGEGQDGQDGRNLR